MAIAHVCARCGWDLAFIRPRPEPHYGLDLVWCPGCGRAEVRREHPIWRRWRESRRAARALAWLGTKAFLAGLVAALTIGAAAGPARTLLNARGWDTDVRLALGAFVAAAVAGGAWVTAGLRHLPRANAWLGWAAFLSGGLVLILAIILLQEEGARDRLDAVWGWARVAAATAVVLVVSVAGIPVGKGIVAGHAAVRRCLVQWRRERRAIMRAGRRARRA